MENIRQDLGCREATKLVLVELLATYPFESWLVGFASWPDVSGRILATAYGLLQFHRDHRAYAEQGQASRLKTVRMITLGRMTAHAWAIGSGTLLIALFLIGIDPSAWTEGFITFKRLAVLAALPYPFAFFAVVRLYGGIIRQAEARAGKITNPS